jgi:glycosyltransferase involved in cell wall biosynthesis
MDADRDRRVAWIINHTTLMAFEVPLLRSFGMEVWTSKRLLHHRDFASASVDFSSDQYSTLPHDVLETLNGHNFYEEEFTPELTQALNRHFGTVICSTLPVVLPETVAHFRGRIVVRAFGREHPSNYSQFIRNLGGAALWKRIREISDRFWFAPCYDSITEIEEPLLRQRSITLPLGLPERTMQQQGSWVGGDNRLLFFCPRIATQFSYYGAIYQEFKKTFGDFPHLIAGNQSKPVNDPAVAGYASDETLEKWLRTFSVMYYHSREPRHLHYHPLEAIVHGMPVIYMQGGLLDALGGADQPGACTTHREARNKVRRILDGDFAFVEEVRHKQQKTLETFTWEYNRREWQQLFVEGVLRAGLETAPAVHSRNHRIAVILPKPYRGGTLRATKDLAKMIKWGSQQQGVDVDVVLTCLKGSYDFDREFTDVKKLGIRVRPLQWKVVQDEARTITELSSSRLGSGLRHGVYALPCDGRNNFLDCDLWLFVSDRLDMPLLPVRPYGAVIFDYIQRYVPEIFGDTSFEIQAQGLIPFVREASFVVVTTPATRADVNAYAGVPHHKISQIPISFELIKDNKLPRLWKEDYLIWVTNPTPQKNHLRVLQALEQYYDEFGGQLRTVMIGTNSNVFSPRNNKPLLDECTDVARVQSFISDSYFLRRNVRIEGELPESAYACAIKHARFLLHGSLYDNGTFAVIDAAGMGVPSLSSRYPAMEFLNEVCQLNLTFFDPYDVEELARGLKAMEQGRDHVRLPDRRFLEDFHWKKNAAAVSDVVLNHSNMGILTAYR